MAVVVWGVLWLYTRPLNVEAAKRFLAVPFAWYVYLSIVAAVRYIQTSKHTWYRHTDIPVYRPTLPTYVSKLG